MKQFYRIFALLVVALLTTASVMAQEAAPEVSIPTSHKLQNVRFEFQGWNNCGPATIANALSYFGYADDQYRAEAWLKPDREDKNVSPWQMAEFVNTQLPELPDVRALVRQGGDMTLLKTLIANDFPVIIEKGYDPPPHDKGWMGHYLLVVGYDDASQVMVTHDSYLGADYNYDYPYIEEFWQHFNYAYIVLYTADREAELTTLLGRDADERQNYIHALEIARDEAVANPDNAFAWFNMGTNLVALDEYERAAVAFDEARNRELPWRMLWYQFGPWEAYNATEQYDKTIELAQRNLNDGGGQYVEETFYYAAVAREKMGETARAIDNYRAAVAFNPNFTPAVEALARLEGEQQS